MRRFILSAALSLCCFPLLFAQELKTGFFLENNVYSYKINPAAPFEEKPYTFFAVGLGNVSATAMSNLGVSSVLYPTASGLVWGFDSDVPTDKFLSMFAKDNIVLPQVNVNLLSFGHQGEKGRFNFELNLRSDNYFYLSKDFFSALKVGLNEGLKSKSGMYSFQNLNASSSNYLEAALGYSHKIGDMITLGGRLKFLMGLGAASVDINNFTGGANEAGDFVASTDVDVLIATSFLKVGTEMVNGKELYDFTTMDFNTIGINGYGFGADLGITIEPVHGLTIGLSALDLGFINWNSTVNGKIKYDLQPIDTVEQGLELQVAPASAAIKKLNYNIHLSAKYRMPFYEGLGVGVLGTYQKYFKEARIGMDFTPFRAISLALSGAYNNFGYDFGGALNIRFPGVNLFLGLDSIYFEMTPQFLPVSRGITNATVGMAIAF
ncbi:MAG: hypothetical protein J5640_08845 [Bacteroidales bacterium]|nr:hypothetical protein [Bacteroidales bacterium]